MPSGVSLCDPHPQGIPLARCRAVGEVPAGNLALDFFFCCLFLFVKALTYTRKREKKKRKVSFMTVTVHFYFCNMQTPQISDSK